MARKGFIYKIYSPQCDKYYIGSTLKSLNDRFRCHKHLEGYASKPLFQYDDVKIELIEELHVENNRELYKREKELILENREHLLNKNYILNDIEKKERNRIARKLNYDEKKQIQCEKMKQYYIDNIQSKKEYYLKNRDKILEYNKRKYRAKREAEEKEIINEMNSGC